MMLYGIAQTVYYTAWDTAHNTYRTGDVTNHTLRWNKDGSANIPNNTPEEVDPTDQPGLYKLELEDSETMALTCRLHGFSSTPDTILIFQELGPIRLPDENFNSQYGLALGGYIEGRTRPTGEYALEVSVQDVLTAGGAGPWQTADLTGIALEATSQQILTTGGTGPWKTADLSDVALEATSQQILTTGGAGPWTSVSAGTVDANVISILGTSLDESTNGNLGDAFSFFYDVDTPNKTINDVGVSGSGLTPQEIWEYASRTITEKDGFSLSSTGLDAIDTWTVTISRVTTVDGCISNADMRGTNNANTTVPDIAGTAAALHNVTDNKIDEVLSDLADHNYWSDSEMAQFRYQIGIDGTTEQPSVVTPNLSQFNPATDLVRANIIQVNGNTDILLAWARNLATIVATQVTDAQESPTPTEFFTDLTEPDTDHFKNRAVIVYDGTIAKQASLITGYQLSNGQGKITVAGFTRAPQAGDTLIIV